MSDDDQWYFDVATGTVSQGKAADVLSRMGPYPDKASAERALETAKQRNDDADRQDEW